MGSDSPELSFLSLHAIISFFVFLIIQKKSNKLFNGALLDSDFSKPQAFHISPIARCGGLATIILLMNFIFMYSQPLTFLSQYNKSNLEYRI